jgi:hypothetical protein
VNAPRAGRWSAGRRGGAASKLAAMAPWCRGAGACARGAHHLIASVAIASVLAAQQPPATAEQLSAALANDTDVTVAWAAHAARELGDKQLAVPLQRALAKWRTTDGEARVVCLHCLDALIALEARMPAGDLLPLVDGEVCGIAGGQGARSREVVVRDERTGARTPLPAIPPAK